VGLKKFYVTLKKSHSFTICYYEVILMRKRFILTLAIVGTAFLDYYLLDKEEPLPDENHATIEVQVKAEVTQPEVEVEVETSDPNDRRAEATYEPPKEEKERFGYSESELDLLARLVRAEAQTEPFEGKVAVARVVINRVDSSQFPDTIKEVIYQKGQFQPVSNGEINKPADDESIKAVEAALSTMTNAANGSLFFYNPDIATSRWLDSRVTAVIIGQHVFKH
jgi:spore germination cell wall hydrolase CwlJ-like protein